MIPESKRKMVGKMENDAVAQVLEKNGAAYRNRTDT
jgi:hypothetical protein